MAVTLASGLSRLLTLLGLPPVAAVVIAILISEDRPLTLRELAERTGYAKSYISTVLRVLEEKLVVEMRRGKRRRVEVSLRPNAIERIIREHIREIRDNLAEILPHLRTRMNSIEYLVSELERLASGGGEG